VSPAHSANEDQKKDEKQLFSPIIFKSAATELTLRDLLPAELMSTEEEDNPDVEIQLIFRRKIAGLRRLPRHQRAQALRAALEWLGSAMAALREKRAYTRHRRNILRARNGKPISDAGILRCVTISENLRN
jgi:hypothetical protein